MTDERPDQARDPGTAGAPGTPANGTPANGMRAEAAEPAGPADGAKPAGAAAPAGAAEPASGAEPAEHADGGETTDRSEPAEPAGGSESTEPADRTETAEGAEAVDGAEPAGAGTDGGWAPVSGLRNPAGALRGAGAGVLSIEALVLLLAVLPLRMLKAPGWGMAAVAILAALAIVLIGLLKRRWAWYAGIVLQALVIATGVAHWAIAVIGCLFAAIWLYVLHVRRTVLGRI
ncbi:DUF4233 domain-containing protein [Actinocatenispora sera]|uniref:DUF4233 domain-containing protein n=1 Tax=Actinocatenispora sera TaxID=390989 RepID=A0A810LBT2_9ACTN|nr:DUF4233 domain-containing protein [Actinocatenispora sera]BCJ32022.1 hypothetical protein Asera_61300 [Actinocatenispora sera]